MKPRKLISLLTDFGLQDGYVGAMHGVIHSICPDIRIIDLTHGVPPQNVEAASFLLRAHSRYFPQGAIFVAVVDPGVGTRRDILLATDERCFYIAPDNGLLSFLQNRPGVRFYAAHNPKYWLPSVSQTFHGRDIFAPLAAHLANGVPFQTLFQPKEHIQPLEQPEAEDLGDAIQGRIIYQDRFGNLVTNIARERLGEREPAYVQFGEDLQLPLVNNYAAVPSNAPLAIWGSFDYLEIAVNHGNAAQTFASRLQLPVILKLKP